jgi:uncharacterized protein (DUF488 family)
VEIYTIGFTKKSADEFFTSLRDHGIRRLIDVRLNNVSQLAGFSKRDDICFFLREIVGAEYLHEPLLAPTQEMLTAYRNREIDWPQYAERFIDLMTERRIEERLDTGLLAAPTVLLCSEPRQDKCHRRLVVDYLNAAWGDVHAVAL